MFLLGPAATQENNGGIDLVRSTIERHGGQIMVCKKWDERKLAYEISKQKRGTYIIAYFTAGPGTEARARAIRRGTRARQAAGSVHTDMERGFVAAEVTFWEDLVRAGGYTAAREQALTRVEGRDYELRDGDVVTFRFTPS